MQNYVGARGASAHPCARVTCHNNVRWPSEREARLKVLAATNMLSASQIGDQLGVTRSSVLGKLKRLGLSIAKPTTCMSPRPRGAGRRRDEERATARERPPRQRTLLRAIVAAAAAELEAVNAEPIVEIAPPATAVRTVHELQPHMCRYPFGDPRHPGFCFCGGDAFKPFPYCAGHARLSYRPARER